VSVVIPAKNEARNLPLVLPRLPPNLHEVILVDGRSSDDTIEVACHLRDDIQIVQQTRTGKGNALACGFAAATGDVIAMLDADGSADPAEIPRFVAALEQGADFAKGSRFTTGGGSADITRCRRFGNRWLNRIVNHFYGTSYTDLCYGYNAFWRDSLAILDLDPGDNSGETATLRWGDGFEVETLINIRIAKAGLHVVEVPSYEHARAHGSSNLHAVSDGLRVLSIIRFERRRSQEGSSRSEVSVRSPAFGGRPLQGLGAAPPTTPIISLVHDFSSPTPRLDQTPSPQMLDHLEP
jgi:glycosyltransferase involved in cell wall biosynthesis